MVRRAQLRSDGGQERAWLGELGTQGSVSMLGHSGGIQNIGLVGGDEDLNVTGPGLKAFLGHSCI